MSESENWRVIFTSTAARQVKKLPEPVIAQLSALSWDLAAKGPIQREWSHYGTLKKGKMIPENSHHCHIKNGRPTYVVCWQVVDKKTKIIEMFYVGTHENAPY